VAEGAPRELIARYCTREVLELRLSDDATNELRKTMDGIAERVEWLPDRVLLYTEGGEETLAQITSIGIQPNSALVRRAGLEDVFLTLTGRSLIE
jgi:lipooligosaccharide transport system ATP-binding protein